jgi:hypothetical protein
VSLAVVDTNVLVVANGGSREAGPECRLAAVESLLAIRRAEALVLDAGYEILAEYRKSCSQSGQPGVGDEFFRWAFENAALLPSVGLTADNARRYMEFPADDALKHFDWDDRVFVSVALMGKPSTRIVNAVDSDYSHYAVPLAAHGVVVEELCPDLLKAKSP